MNNYIKLKKITHREDTLTIDFETSDNLSKYFSGVPFSITYSANIDEVPDSIAAIPFVCNVLPIVWLENATLILNELDQSFYNAIPNIKQGYIDMYPESTFAGSIEVEHIHLNHSLSSGNKAMLFSGGVDSFDTLIRHHNECPELVMMWGADIRYENESGWNTMYSILNQTAELFQLKPQIIRSTFRAFINEGVLDSQYANQLKDYWWHGIQHSIGLLGHIAPLAYINSYDILYIAATNVNTDTNIRCASHPSIDNQVRFSNCQVIHDGFTTTRQNKIKNILEYHYLTKDRLPIHVCWETQTGNNCCHCEKCYRTIFGILAEGGDPSLLGFDTYKTHLINSKTYLFNHNFQLLSYFWIPIRNRFRHNYKSLSKTADYKYIRWIKNCSFKPSIYTRINKKVKNFLRRTPIYRLLKK